VKRCWLPLAVALSLLVLAPAVPAQASAPSRSGAILFVSDRDSTDAEVFDDVYALVPRTGRTYRITRSPDIEWHATVSPDGQALAYVHIAVTDGVPAPLSTADLRTCRLRWRHSELTCGHERTLVAAGGLAPTTPLSWTPNGRAVFYGGIDPVDFDGDVFAVSTRGGDPRNLTQEPAGQPAVFDGQPNVAEDGRRFVYSSAGDVYQRRIDGSDPVQLTSGPRNDGHPELSPDGRHVTFQTTSPGDFDVWVMRAGPEGPGNPAVDLTAGRVDTTGAVTQERLPTWSPDGTRIAYMWHTEFYAPNPFVSGFDEGEIYSMRPDGTDVRNETDNNTATDSPGDIIPDWGPLPAALRPQHR
jgi:Tol biopolymer transport system component